MMVWYSHSIVQHFTAVKVHQNHLTIISFHYWFGQLTHSMHWLFPHQHIHSLKPSKPVISMQCMQLTPPISLLYLMLLNRVSPLWCIGVRLMHVLRSQNSKDVQIPKQLSSHLNGELVFQPFAPTASPTLHPPPNPPSPFHAYLHTGMARSLPPKPSWISSNRATPAKVCNILTHIPVFVYICHPVL